MTTDSPAPNIPDFPDYESWWGNDPVAIRDAFSCESVGPSGHTKLTIADGQLRLETNAPEMVCQSWNVADVSWWSVSTERPGITVVIGLEEQALSAHFPHQMRACIETGLGSTLGYGLQTAAA